MEKAIARTTEARLSVVGVMSLVPMAPSYRPYPTVEAVSRLASYRPSYRSY